MRSVLAIVPAALRTAGWLVILLAVSFFAVLTAGLPLIFMLKREFTLFRVIPLQASLITLCLLSLFPEWRARETRNAVRFLCIPVVYLMALWTCTTLAVTPPSSIMAMTAYAEPATLWLRPPVLIQIGLLLAAASAVGAKKRPESEHGSSPGKI